MVSQRRRGWLKRVARAIVVLGILYVMLRWFEHSLIYHPTRTLEGSPAELKRPFEDVSFTASDGVRLHGWYFPADTNSPRAHLAILSCHGNGGNISHRLGQCEVLLRTGAAVFIFDFRGYGQSEGRAGEEGTYLDTVAAHDWLTQRGFRGEDIVAFGESLGGGLATELALRRTVGGVVLQSAFTSIPDIGVELYPWLPVRWINTVKYDNLAKLPRLHVPVLVMHSREDDLTAFHHGERNLAAANQPKFFCELRGPHNEAYWTQPEFQEAMEKFVSVVEARAHTAATR